MNPDDSMNPDYRRYDGTYEPLEPPESTDLARADGSGVLGYGGGRAYSQGDLGTDGREAGCSDDGFREEGLSVLPKEGLPSRGDEYAPEDGGYARGDGYAPCDGAAYGREGLYETRGAVPRATPVGGGGRRTGWKGLSPGVRLSIVLVLAMNVILIVAMPCFLRRSNPKDMMNLDAAVFGAPVAAVGQGTDDATERARMLQYEMVGVRVMTDPKAAIAMPGRGVAKRRILADATEVTVERFRTCVAAGACSPQDFISQGEHGEESLCNYGRSNDRDLYPMNCVSMKGARDYCAWKGKRLPTRDEWIAMPHQVPPRDAGNDGDCRNWDPILTTASGGDTYMVGSHPANARVYEMGNPRGRPRNATDMVDVDGNVAEWVEIDSGSSEAEDTGRKGDELGGVQGRGYTEAWDAPRIFKDMNPWTKSPKIGFRCVKDAAD